MKRFIPLLLLTSLGAPAAAAGQRTDSSASMSLISGGPIRLVSFAARAKLVSLLGRLIHIKSVRDVKINRHRVVFTADIQYDASSRWANRSKTGAEGRFEFARLAKLSIEDNNGWEARLDGKYLTIEGVAVKEYPVGAVEFESKSDGMFFATALDMLREAALVPDTEAADFDAFRVAAAAWQQMTTKPAMSDEARMFQLVAEDALSRRDLYVALIAYERALRVDGMWADGQYNAAVLSDQTGDYELVPSCIN